MLETIIFDWNGAFTEDIGPLIRTKIKLFDKYKLPRVPYGELRSNLMANFPQFWQRHLSSIPMDEAYKDFNRIFKKQVRPLIHGAENVLKLLRSKKVEMYVLSSHDESMLEQDIRQHGIHHYFNKVYGGRMRKDEVLAEILEENSLGKTNTLYVGDTVDDMHAGKKNNVKTAAVLSGYHNETLLRRMHPDYVFQDITGLKTLFN